MRVFISSVIAGIEDYRAATSRFGTAQGQINSPAEGVPDGMAVDRVGGGRVRRYTPDGRLNAVVRVPIRQVMSCAFGDGQSLCITCAAFGFGADEPRAGSLFAADVGVTGLPATPCRAS